jgi:hypothetical protein
MNALKWIGIAVIVGLITAGLAMVAVKPRDSFVETVRTTIPMVRERLPQAYRDGYMEGCNEDGTQKKYCECTVNYLEDNYSVDAVVDMSIEYSEDSSVMPEMVKKAAMACIDLYN